MKLLTLLTLAVHLCVDAVALPPAVSRDTFGTASGARWRSEPASSLWDVRSIAALLERWVRGRDCC